MVFVAKQNMFCLLVLFFWGGVLERAFVFKSVGFTVLFSFFLFVMFLVLFKLPTSTFVNGVLVFVLF